MDSLVSRILLCTADSTLLESIVRRVSKKLATVPDEEILDLWGKVLHEFQESRWHGHLPRDAEFIPDGFFEPSDRSEIRERGAVFIGWLQQRLKVKAAERGHQVFPMGVPGVASVLSARAGLVRPMQDRRLATYKAVKQAKQHADPRLCRRFRLCPHARLQLRLMSFRRGNPSIRGQARCLAEPVHRVVTQQPAYTGEALVETGMVRTLL